MPLTQAPKTSSSAALLLIHTSILALILAVAIPSTAQTFTSLHSFTGTDGSYPYAGLIQSTSGKLLGTTSYGGSFSGGTVFMITPAGTLTSLYSFCKLASCT